MLDDTIVNANIETLLLIKDHDRKEEPKKSLLFGSTTPEDQQKYYADLEESIRINGILNPLEIGIDKDGKMLIIEGNTRLMISAKLNWKSLPVKFKFVDEEDRFYQNKKNKFKNLNDIKNGNRR